MSLDTNLQTFATRLSTEMKAIRTLLNSNAADNAALTTTAKGNLVAAINELDAAIDAAASTGGATDLDQLTDVAITTAALGNLLRHNGTSWVNIDGATLFQALDSDLTSIAALTTTAYGRAFLTLSDQAGLMALVQSASETVAGKVELATTAEANTGSDTSRAVTPAGLNLAVQNRLDALVAAAPGTLDTLNELAAALGDDPNFATTINTALANRVRTDTAAQGLDVTQQSNARTNIGAAASADVGSTTTDYVSIFEAGLI